MKLNQCKIVLNCTIKFRQWNSNFYFIADFKSKTARIDALREISNALGCSSKEAYDKMRNLRVQFFAERRKTLMKRAETDDDSYTSKWPYYNVLKFIEFTNPEVIKETEDHYKVPRKKIRVKHESSSRSDNASDDDPLDERKTTAFNQPIQPNESSHYFNTNCMDEDEFATAGKRIGYQLKALTDHQRIIAEKLISDVIYFAKLDKLSENSQVSM